VTLSDPEVVRREYATERGLARRKSAYRFAEVPDFEGGLRVRRAPYVFVADR
jgi:hypothetical protein